jgi:hypothetical protein
MLLMTSASKSWCMCVKQVMNYINLEGVPESSAVDNFLEEVTLFKNHLSRLPEFSPTALRADTR